MKNWTLVIGLVLALLVPGQSLALTTETEKVNVSAEVLQEIMAIPEKSIPPTLLRNAYAVAIIPGVIKGAFFIGGRHGKGVILVRQNTGSFGPPAFISLTGGSLGFQFGAQSTDIILVFKSRKSVDGIINGKFTIGADASAAAGPVGRSAAAKTDIVFKAEIYSYSRSRGLFAGVSLEGAALEIDGGANGNFYRQPNINAGDILYSQGLSVPQAGVELQRKLQQYAISPPG